MSRSNRRTVGRGAMRGARAVLIATALAACGGDGPTAPMTPRLQIVAGDSIRDTIEAQPAAALVVRLTDGRGRGLSGRVIRFAAVPASIPTAGVAQVNLVPITSALASPFVADTTDARGQAAVLVRFGPIAGTARVSIGEPLDGLADTATYIVTAGAPTRIAMRILDTALYVGGTAEVGATVTDRYGNPRPEAPSLASTQPAIADLSGTVATARAIGVDTIAATIGTAKGIMGITVVPKATLAAIGSQGLVVFGADGSGLRLLAAGNGTTTAWSPDGSAVVSDQDTGPLRVVSLAGPSRLLPTTGGWSLYPKYSADGNWIYFCQSFGAWQLHRIHPDGTGDVAFPYTSYAYDIAPSPSPDGSRVVFTVTGGTPGDALWMLDPATGSESNLGINGHQPNWSPTGALITYLGTGDGGRLHVMRPDGSGDRIVGIATHSYSFGHGWSPDGDWIIARDATIDRLEMIQLSTGLVLPLGQFTAGMHGPSWSP